MAHDRTSGLGTGMRGRGIGLTGHASLGHRGRRSRCRCRGRGPGDQRCPVVVGALAAVAQRVEHAGGATGHRPARRQPRPYRGRVEQVDGKTVGGEDHGFHPVQHDRGVLGQPVHVVVRQIPRDEVGGPLVRREGGFVPAAGKGEDVAVTDPYGMSVTTARSYPARIDPLSSVAAWLRRRRRAAGASTPRRWTRGPSPSKTPGPRHDDAAPRHCPPRGRRGERPAAPGPSAAR